jgi:hypothetical protein
MYVLFTLGFIYPSNIWCIMLGTENAKGEKWALPLNTGLRKEQSPLFTTPCETLSTIKV